MSSLTAPLVSVADDELTESAISFLSTSPQDDPLIYQTRLQNFQKLLQNYLAEDSPDSTLILRIERDGMTFLFPVSFVDAQSVFRRDLLEITSQPKDVRSAGLKGEILDMAWLDQENQQNLLVLFPDSLLVLAADDLNLTRQVIHFEETALSPGRRAFPQGRLQIRATANGESPEPGILVMTSSLMRDLFFGLQDGLLVSHPQAKLLVAKGEPFVSFNPSDENSFRSIRGLPGGLLARLDIDGYLELQEQETGKIIWRSQRAWGDRLFLLQKNVLAVCNSRNNTFEGFRLVDRKLVRLGQAPAFEGRVEAVVSAQIERQSGLLVALVNEHSGRKWSRLQFAAENEFSWTLPDASPVPMFPDLEAQLTLVLSKDGGRKREASHHNLPPVVWSAVVETLFNVTKTGQSITNLVSHFQSDSSRKMWDFELSTGIRFSDDSALTAEAVRTSWLANWRNCLKTNCPSAWLWQNIAGSQDFVAGKTTDVSGLQVLGEMTLRVELAAPRPNLPVELTQLCFGVSKENSAGGSRVGTGPFQLAKTRFDGGTSVYYCTGNPYYHRGQPPLRGIEFRFQKDDIIDTMTEMRADATIAHIRADIRYFNQIDAYATQPFPQTSVYFLALNAKSAPLTSEGFRKFLGLELLNRSELAEIVTEAEAFPAESFIVDFPGGLVASSNGAPKLRPARSLHIAFRAGDLVAKQISERLAALCSQAEIQVRAPKGLSDEDFELLRTSDKYDILIDSYAPEFGNPAYDLMQLLQRGYVVPDGLLARAGAALASPSRIKFETMERELSEQAVLFPLIRVQTYAVLPAQLRDVELRGEDQLNFSRAWLPRTR